MADVNSKKVEDVVPFFASSDDYYRVECSEDKPVMLINPEASSQDLWLVAEARLQHLQKVLGIFVCVEDCGVDFGPAEYAELFKPRVDEILILAAEANKRAKAPRGELRVVSAG